MKSKQAARKGLPVFMTNNYFMNPTPVPETLVWNSLACFVFSNPRFPSGIVTFDKIYALCSRL